MFFKFWANYKMAKTGKLPYKKPFLKENKNTIRMPIMKDQKKEFKVTIIE